MLINAGPNVGRNPGIRHDTLLFHTRLTALSWGRYISQAYESCTNKIIFIEFIPENEDDNNIITYST